jgi:hypothetical protein
MSGIFLIFIFLILIESKYEKKGPRSHFFSRSSRVREQLALQPIRQPAGHPFADSCVNSSALNEMTTYGEKRNRKTCLSRCKTSGNNERCFGALLTHINIADTQHWTMNARVSPPYHPDEQSVAYPEYACSGPAA